MPAPPGCAAGIAGAAGAQQLCASDVLQAVALQPSGEGGQLAADLLRQQALNVIVKLRPLLRQGWQLRLKRNQNATRFYDSCSLRHFRNKLSSRSEQQFFCNMNPASKTEKEEPDYGSSDVLAKKF